MDNPYRLLASSMAAAALAGLPVGALAVRILVDRRGRLPAWACPGLGLAAAVALLLGVRIVWVIITAPITGVILIPAALGFALGAATMALIDLAILLLLDLTGRKASRMPPWSRWPALVGIGLGLAGVGLAVWAVWSENRTILDESEALAALGLVLAMTAAATLTDAALRVGLPEVDRSGRRLR